MEQVLQFLTDNLIPILIGVGAVIVLLAVILMIKGGKKSIKKTLTSTQQFLPILDVRDDIIVTKDERYIKLMEFSPINFELRSPAEQDQIISAFGSAIRTWPKNVHIKVVTTPSNVSDFIKELESCREVEESEACRDLQTDQIQMLERISQTQGVTRRFFVSFEYENAGGFRKAPTFQEIKSSLDKQARSVQSTLESCGNSLISIEDRDYVLSALYTCACKAQSDAVTWEERKAYVEQRYEEKFGPSLNTNRIPAGDYIAPDRIDSCFGPTYMIVDGKYMTHCFLPSNAYPVQAYAGWLQVLFAYMDDVYVDFWIQKEPVQKVQPKLQLALKNNKIKAKNTEDISMDYDDIESAVSAGYYIKQALSNGDEFCYIATMLTIFADSLEELREKYREMYNYCIRNDMKMRYCTAQQDEAYISSLPCMPLTKGIFGKSKRNVMATQLGSCYPFTAYELCDKGGVFLGINARYGSPVFVNLFDTTKYQNANMMIFGPSGSGKTYTLLSMLLRMRQKQLQVYVIAPLKGFEFRRACTAVGGEFIQINPGSQQNINIMEIRKKDTTDSDIIDGIADTAKGSILVNKIQQLHRFFSLLFPDLDASEKQLLDETLVKTYAKFGITQRNKSLLDPERKGHYKQMPVLGDLYKELERAGEGGKRMKNLLSRFVTGSAKSFNMQTNVNLDNKFVVIDVSNLTDELLPIGMFIALDYVLDKAEANRTERKVIAIDEMWKLMRASKLSAEFVVEVFKIIRGYAGSAIGATQDLDDVLANEFGAAIINNSKTKLLLPMDKKEADAVSSVIDLTSEELKQLKRTETQRTSTGERKASKALMVANTNHIFINIEASKTEHNLITTSADDLRRLSQQQIESA